MSGVDEALTAFLIQDHIVYAHGLLTEGSHKGTVWLIHHDGSFRVRVKVHGSARIDDDVAMRIAQLRRIFGQLAPMGHGFVGMGASAGVDQVCGRFSVMRKVFVHTDMAEDL